MSNARFSIIQSRAISDELLSASCLRTLAALGMYGDQDGWCFPNQTTLGKLLNKTRQAVSKDIQTLKALGYLEVQEQFREDGSQTSNLYRLIFDMKTPVAGGVQSLRLQGVQPLEVAGGETSEVAPLTSHINVPNNDLLYNNICSKQMFYDEENPQSLDPEDPPQPPPHDDEYIPDVTNSPELQAIEKLKTSLPFRGELSARDRGSLLLIIQETGGTFTEVNKIIGFYRYVIGKNPGYDQKMWYQVVDDAFHHFLKRQGDTWVRNKDWYLPGESSMMDMPRKDSRVKMRHPDIMDLDGVSVRWKDASVQQIERYTREILYQEPGTFDWVGLEDLDEAVSGSWNGVGAVRKSG